MQKGLALFDFDGTITRKDSLLEFMKYAVGKWKFYLTMGIFSPLIFYYIFIKKDGSVAKRKVLSFLFKGKSREELDRLGKSFSEEIVPSILITSAMEEIELHKKQNDRVIVISASLENWLKPWADSMNLEVICTQLEFVKGKFSGRFATPNCNGQEKVNRIKAYLNPEDYNPIFAYGNSSGDKPMLDMADHGFYRHFE